MPQIAVIGAGLMGHGIALSFARAGHAVAVWDPLADSLAALPERITQSLQLLGAGPSDIAALGTCRLDGYFFGLS